MGNQGNQSLLIIDSDSNFRRTIEETITPLTGRVKVLGAVADFHEGLRIIEGEAPTIVILEARELEKGTVEVGHILSNYPGVSVFVTAKEKDPDWILTMIRAGATEYLTKPVIAKELTDAITKVTRLHATRRAPPRKTGSVICLYSPCAGIGTTTLAVNLAAAVTALDKRALLVDLNLCTSDVTTFLDFAPRYHLATVAAKRGHVDTSLLNSVVAQHPCGINVLGSPPHLSDTLLVVPELIKELVPQMRALFDYTFIDCGGQLYGLNLTAFHCADLVLFNTVLNLPLLHTARRHLSAMGEEGLTDEKVRLVVNRYIPKDEIKLGDAEKALGTKAYATVPNAYADVKTSINKGTPLVFAIPKSPVAKSIAELGGRLAAATTARAIQENAS